MDPFPTLLTLDEVYRHDLRIAHTLTCGALLPPGEHAAVHYPPREQNSAVVRVCCAAPTTHVRLVRTGAHSLWRSVCDDHTTEELS